MKKLLTAKSKDKIIDLILKAQTSEERTVDKFDPLFNFLEKILEKAYNKGEKDIQSVLYQNDMLTYRE